MGYLTLADLKDQIKVSLGGSASAGGGGLCVELSDQQIDQIINMTRRWWIAYVGGVRKLKLMHFGSGEQTFTLDLEVEDVTQVYFEIKLPLQMNYPELFDAAIPWGGSIASMVGGLGATPSAGFMPYSGLAQALQSIETNKRILSADQDFDFDKRTKILTIFPRSAVGGAMMIDFLSNDFQLEELSADEAEIFFRWAEAEAFEKVGLIRSKYTSFPIPGGERQLNGDRLIELAREKKEILRKEVIDMFKPGFFIAE